MEVCGCADESGLKFANFARWVMLQFVDLADIEFDAQATETPHLPDLPDLSSAQLNSAQLGVSCW